MIEPIYSCDIPSIILNHEKPTPPYLEKEQNKVILYLSGLNLLNQIEHGKLISKGMLINDWYQQLALHAAYAEWINPENDEGAFVPGLQCTGNYEVYKDIRNIRNLRILVLKPTDPRNSHGSLVLFRGTCRSDKGVPSIHNLVDDFSEKIGSYGVKHQSKKICRLLKKVSQELGPLTFLGHSLGGAHAQTVALHIHKSLKNTAEKTTQVIKKIWHLGSPGINLKPEQAQDIQQQQEEGTFPQSIGYAHYRDIVWRAGGNFLPGKFHLFGNKQKTISRVHAHIKTELISSYIFHNDCYTASLTNPGIEKIRTRIEFCRRFFGSPVEKIIHQYLNQKDTKQLEANSS